MPVSPEDNCNILYLVSSQGDPECEEQGLGKLLAPTDNVFVLDPPGNSVMPLKVVNMPLKGKNKRGIYAQPLPLLLSQIMILLCLRIQMAPAKRLSSNDFYVFQ